MGITPNEEPEGPRVHIECKVSTLNVCTIASKRGEVEVLLRTTGIGVLAIQETRRVETGWPVRIAGYAVFESPAVRDEQGKNGLAVCVSEDHQAFEVGAVCPYTQHRTPRSIFCGPRAIRKLMLLSPNTMQRCN